MSKSRTGSSRPPTPSSRTSGRRPPPPATGGAGIRPVLVIAIFIAVLAVGAGVIFITSRGGDADQAGSPTVEVAHVHGLGVDAADGALYAGTHHGLIRLPEQGVASRVADRVQDFMGFTVVGPDRYLASGHPGEGQDGPSALGLIESTDGGLSWQSLSLAGEADFHVLEARHGLVYGLNSMTGQLMVSADEKTWETRTGIPMVDFGVSPDDPEVLMATTERGLVRSADGGRSFQLMPAAPLLQLVSWAPDGSIVGVAPDGTVHASTTDGQTWERRGMLDAAPHALTATSDSDVFAAVDGAILGSTDGGRSFTARYRE